MAYKFLENVAVADVAFEASGKTLKELFESAALAVTNTMIENLKGVGQKIKKEIKVSAKNVEMLLFNFLQEIIFYKDAEQLLFNKFEVEIIPKNNFLQAVVKAHGEKINTKKHKMIVDVKAVTLHNFELKETDGGWIARIILDV